VGYLLGINVTEQSYEEAAQWYRKAADQGLANAQCKLGMMFSQGCGVAQSELEAARWFKMAAEQCDAEAQLNLGLLFEEDHAVEAAHWSTGTVGNEDRSFVGCCEDIGC
jgi:TPR repeat protein